MESLIDPVVRSETIFEYEGALTEGAIAATSGSLRTRLQVCGIPQDVARKIFSSYVELAYNIVHYGEQESNDGRTPIRRGCLRVIRNESDHRISARNRVSEDTAKFLVGRLEQLRAMTADEIRFEYRLRLTNLQFEESSSKGAGLGLLTLARNAVQPLQFELYADERDPACRTFDLQVVIR